MKVYTIEIPLIAQHFEIVADNEGEAVSQAVQRMRTATQIPQGTPTVVKKRRVED